MEKFCSSFGWAAILKQGNKAKNLQQHVKCKQLGTNARTWTAQPITAGGGRLLPDQSQALPLGLTSYPRVQGGPATLELNVSFTK